LHGADGDYVRGGETGGARTLPGARRVSGERALAARGAVPGGEPGTTMGNAVIRISEPEVLGLLTRLVEKSLVVYEEDDQGHGRYRLMETVRQYAWERLLESGEGDGVWERHLRYFLALAEEAEPHL